MRRIPHTDGNTPFRYQNDFALNVLDDRLEEYLELTDVSFFKKAISFIL